MLMSGEFTKRELAAFLLRILLGAFFAGTGFSKAASLDAFILSIKAYNIIPVSFALAFAIVIVSMEISFGLSLIFGFFTRLSAAVLSILSLVFLTAMAIEIVRGSNAECGCFGVMVHEKIGVASALRDSVLLSVSI